MYKRLIYFLLIFFLASDLAYSFVQYYNTPFDGDLAGGIVPASNLNHLFHDPFGIFAWTKDYYPNPNRFFAHFTFYQYFNILPYWLNNFMSPVNAAYFAAALGKTGIHFIILFSLATVISRKSILAKESIIAALIMTPFFQANGYRSYMGVIDISTTYSFFYGLPCAILILFYRHFFLENFRSEKPNSKPFTIGILALLILFLSFNGPLLPGIVLSVTITYFLSIWKKSGTSIRERNSNFYSNVPKKNFWFFSVFSIICGYSLLLGARNAMFGEFIPLGERFARLPLGLYYIFTQKPGWSILILSILFQLIILHSFRNSEKVLNAMQLFKWIGVFSMIYVLALPFGGYRWYRPNIIRYDTFLPITILAIFVFGYASVLLMELLQKRKQLYFKGFIVLVALVFTNADRIGLEKNDYEKSVLTQISKSGDLSLLHTAEYSVLTWGNPRQTNKGLIRLNEKLLQRWKIATPKRLQNRVLYFSVVP